jgi:hypothetical protein
MAKEPTKVTTHVSIGVPPTRRSAGAGRQNETDESMKTQTAVDIGTVVE